MNRVSKLKVNNNNRVVQTFASWTGGRQGDFGSSSSGSLHLQAKVEEETPASVSPFGKKAIFKMISAWSSNNSKIYYDSQKLAASPPFFLAPAPIRQKLWP